MDFPIYCDSSMLTAWRSCKRRHFWSTINSLYPMGKSVHLIAGAAFAAGLEAARHRIFLDPNPSSVTHLEALIAAYPAMLKQWGLYDPPEASAKTFVNTLAALDYYLNLHWPATDTLQPWIRPDGTPAVEYKFAVPLDDILHPITKEPMLFVGRFDMIGQIPYKTGSSEMLTAVVDEKTTSSITYDWATKWDMRGQFLGYIWALRAQGIPCSHAIVRGVAIQKTQTVVKTALIQYPEHLITRWEHQMKADLRSMIHSWMELQDWPTADQSLYPYNFGDSCESYGGCAFASLCIAKEPEPFFSNFIRHRFNPLELQPVEELPNE